MNKYESSQLSKLLFEFPQVSGAAGLADAASRLND